MHFADPTQCADGSRIIPTITTVFPSTKKRATGGVICHRALGDVLHNLDEKADRDVFERPHRIDNICTHLGEYHYAAALAEKSILDERAE